MKKKKVTFFFAQATHIRKINWWSFLEVFECYNYGELEYSEEDFVTGIVVILYFTP